MAIRPVHVDTAHPGARHRPGAAALARPPDVLDPAEAPSAGGKHCRETVPCPLQGHNLSISLNLTKL